ncbi:peptide deformylase [Streptomyces violascens]|uniref:peptide deformylase n=1 Tax=Streptomyces violascens TaxID=67381 RepID=UPI0016771E69|nr:peptide deformylase [Streptomyces violascens]GGU37825.1 hypothetical protein GCM10010289_68450 [Streptomyces violascens]
MTEVRPSQRMRDLGVVQHGAPALYTPSTAFDLPAERATAELVIDQLTEAMDRIARAHDFSGKGMGLAAPQINIAHAAAAVRPAAPGAETLVLLNPRITASSDEIDEQYEGCLSFFDVRGVVPRPLRITVETTALDGSKVTTVYERGLARLVQHEVDHLEGHLYIARMRPGVDPIPVEEYRQTGRAWAYDQ